MNYYGVWLSRLHSSVFSIVNRGSWPNKGSSDQWVGHIQAHESWWCGPLPNSAFSPCVLVMWSRLQWKSANNTKSPGLLFVLPQRTSCHTFTSIPLVITITSLPCNGTEWTRRKIPVSIYCKRKNCFMRLLIKFIDIHGCVPIKCILHYSLQ